MMPFQIRSVGGAVAVAGMVAAALASMALSTTAQAEKASSMAAISKSAKSAEPSEDATSSSSSFFREWVQWRHDRLDGLRSESGWLTLVGLHWLKPGENRFGSDPSLPVPLPKGRAPLNAGVFILKDGKVRMVANPDSGIRLDDKPVGERDLKTDAAGSPDTLQIGSLSFYVIQRGERVGIRVKDSESPLRKEFKGTETFPPDPKWRVAGEFIPYGTSRDVEIPTILGTIERMRAPGLVKFRIIGQELSLEPVVEDPDHPELFFIFKDRSSGKETYGSGRFLYAEMPKSGKVVLDFNRATNPPCAFTPYATCPLPPKQNWLPIRVEAGEKAYGEHAALPVHSVQ